MLAFRTWSRLELTCLVALAAAGFGLPAQELARLNLRIKESIRLPSDIPVAIELPIRCDSGGHIYLSVNALAGPVTKLSPEGKILATFSLSGVPGYKSDQFYDFAVGLRGEVYLLGTKARSELVFAKFSGEGRYLSETRPSPPFFPARLAVFPGGNFLAAGMKLKDGKLTNQSFTAVYDTAGRLLHDLSQSVEPKASEDKDPDPKKIDEQRKNAVFLGDAMPADDGNIYLFRPSNPPAVHIISPAGEALRTLVIPSPSTDAEAFTMKVAGGRVIVHFQSRDTSGRPLHIFPVIDVATGDHLFNYVAGPEIGGGLACYSPNGLTFLSTTPDRRPVLLQVVPY